MLFNFTESCGCTEIEGYKFEISAVTNLHSINGCLPKPCTILQEFKLNRLFLRKKLEHR